MMSCSELPCSFFNSSCSTANSRWLRLRAGLILANQSRISIIILLYCHACWLAFKDLPLHVLWINSSLFSHVDYFLRGADVLVTILLQLNSGVLGLWDPMIA